MPATPAVDLLAPLRDSFRRLLQADVPPELRAREGLHAAFASVSPIVSATGELELDFGAFTVGRPEDVGTCLRTGRTFAAPCRLVARCTRRAGGDGAPQDVREQEVWFGEVPLMDDDGTFVVDGERRILVPREAEVWLPEDGPPGPPRRRVLWPGEWLQLAASVGLRRLVARVHALWRYSDPPVAPAELVDGSLVVASLCAFLTHPGISEPIEEIGAGNPLARLDRLRRIGEPVVLGEDGLPASRRSRRREARVTLPVPGTPWSIGEALVPFAEDVGVRVAGDAAQRAASPPVSPTPPRVRTGWEDAVDGGLALGREALVMFDDVARGAVVSKGFAAAMASRRLVRYDAVIRHTMLGPEELTRDVEGGGTLDDEGIVRVGALVATGDPLVGILSWSELPRTRRAARELRARYPRGDPAAALLAAIEGRPIPGGPPRADRSVRVAAGVTGTVSAVDAEHREGANLPPGVQRRVRVVVEQLVPLAVGDHLGDRRGHRVRVARILPDDEMPRCEETGEAVDVLLPGGAVPAGTERECRLGLAARLLGEPSIGALLNYELDALTARAGVRWTTRAGALYLLRLPRTRPVEGAHRRRASGSPGGGSSEDLVKSINSQEFRSYHAAWCKAGIRQGAGPEAIQEFVDDELLYLVPEHARYTDLLTSRWEPIPRDEAVRLVAAIVAHDQAHERRRAEEEREIMEEVEGWVPDTEAGPDFVWLQQVFFERLFDREHVRYFTNARGWMAGDKAESAPAVAGVDGQVVGLFWLN